MAIAQRCTDLRLRWSKISNAWLKMQITHYGGAYSIERMLALEEYCKKTSIMRALLVSIAVPVFTATLVVCQESVPLQDPEEGWGSNYGFWIRVGLLGTVMAYAFESETRYYFSIPELSSIQVVVYCSAVGASSIACGMIAAELLVFPVPFFIFSISSVIVLCIAGFYLLVAGARVVRQIVSQGHQIRQLRTAGALQAATSVVYPAYQAFFSKTSNSRYELPVLLLMPLVKRIMKAAFLTVAVQDEDLVPEQVIFVVDFFNALYLVTFMQIFSPAATACVMAFDILHTMMELHELHKKTASILARFHEYFVIATQADHSNLLAVLKSVCCDSKVIQSQTVVNFRVRSTLLHHLSPDGSTLLHKCEMCLHTTSRIPINNEAQPHMTFPHQFAPKKYFARGSLNIVAVKPQVCMEVVPKLKGSSLKQKRPSERELASSILHEALQVLFTSECLILAEYVEIIIPVLYGTFLLLLVRLPSAEYHTEMIGVTQENVGSMVLKMYIYATLELISFVLLGIVAWRNCRIKVLHQLAFVLETQTSLVLSKLMLWILFTLTYRVTHFGECIPPYPHLHFCAGVDFTFQFEWIKKNKT